MRFGGLANLPEVLNRDEAAIGYNAYSLLKTGKDEHGETYPLAFKSIGDYKMPGYIYATMLPVKLLGLNEWSIRFWSAFGGVLAVWALYGIGKKLTNERVGIIAAFLMALNPWAVFYSRVGFEANLALALFLLGLTWRWWWWLPAMLTYSSSLIFMPLFALVNLRPNKKLLLFLVAGGLIFVSIFRVSVQKQAITVWSDPSTLDYYAKTRTAVMAESPLLARTWWNRYVFFARRIGINYLNTFSPKFLLTEGGGHPWHQIPGQGYFYLWEIIFAAAGGWWLWKKGKPKTRLLLFSWLLLAPLPSAITIDAPHATRSLHLLPVILLLAAYGFSAWLKQKPARFMIGVVLAVYFLQVGLASYRYLVDYPVFATKVLPGELKDKVLSGETELTGLQDSAYLYALIYSGFDPVVFQKEALWTPPDPAGLSNAYQFGEFIILP